MSDKPVAMYRENCADGSRCLHGCHTNEPCHTRPQPKAEQGEPVTFEEWLSKQHGDPEEIGFLQALRIAYISGQNSITTPQPRKPLTDEAIATVYWGATGQSLRPQDNVLAHKFAKAIESAHGIKE